MKTLIIYATKYGSTEKCAKLLSEKLIQKTDLCNLKKDNIPSFDQYEKIIIGGSIYMGKIQKEINNFCMKNLSLLKDKKVGLFICSMNKEGAESLLNSVFPKELLDGSVKGVFGGEIVPKSMNFFDKSIIKMVSKSDENLKNMDMDKGTSMINYENIDRFSELMNKA